MVSLKTGEVREAILAFNCPHLVVTGGEPLLQQRELAPLAVSLKAEGFYCEVETNGTIVPGPELARCIDQWNVSPKLGSSGNRKDIREAPEALDAFSRLPNAYFKFVIVEPPDVDEVCQLRDRHQLPSDRIILMPEGTAVESITSRSRWITDACVTQGFRFSTRLHILLWGDQRGR